MPPASPPAVTLALDATALDASCAFYARTLGFSVVSSQRDGLIYEERCLRSPAFPALELRLRQAFGIRPVGSGPGRQRAVGLWLHADARRDLIRRLAGQVDWLGTPPNPEAEALTNAPAFGDPDGYVIELHSPRPA